jgi:hypothetical protein
MVMFTEPIERRYEEVCDRLALALQQIARLELQVSRLKTQLANTEEFIDRITSADPTWESQNLTEPPHHIRAE